MLEERARGSARRPGIDMRAWLKELRTMGKPILVSSHILPELADICNKIGIIEKGKLLFDGDVASAIRRVRQHLVLDVKVANDMLAAARDRLQTQAEVLKIEVKEDDTMRVTLNDDVHDGS